MIASIYYIEKYNNYFNHTESSFCFLYRKPWKKIKADLEIFELIFEKKVDMGLLSKIIFKNINQKNKTIINEYNNLTNGYMLTIEEIKLLKKYIICN